MTFDTRHWIWWTEANSRRQDLIYKKHIGGGLTKHEEFEYRVLQATAEAIVNETVRDSQEPRHDSSEKPNP